MLNIETNTIVNRCILCWCWALSLNQRKYKMLNIETNKIVNICTLCQCRAFSCLQKLTKRIQIGSTTFFLVAARNVSEAGQSVQLDITETSKSDSHQRPITSDPFVGISAKYWRDITDVSPCHTCAALKTYPGTGGHFFSPHSPARDPQKQVINIMDQCWWCECLCSLTIMPKAARFQAQCHTFHQWLQKMLIEVTLLRLYFRQKWRYEIFHSYIWYNTYSPSF